MYILNEYMYVHTHAHIRNNNKEKQTINLGAEGSLEG